MATVLWVCLRQDLLSKGGTPASCRRQVRAWLEQRLQLQSRWWQSWGNTNRVVSNRVVSKGPLYPSKTEIIISFVFLIRPRYMPLTVRRSHEWWLKRWPHAVETMAECAVDFRKFIVFLGRDPGTLKSDIVSKKHPQLICSDLRLSNWKFEDWNYGNRPWLKRFPTYLGISDP